VEGAEHAVAHTHLKSSWQISMEELLPTALQRAQTAAHLDLQVPVEAGVEVRVPEAAEGAQVAVIPVREKCLH